MRDPDDVEARPVAPQRADERGSEGEAEDDVAVAWATSNGSEVAKLAPTWPTCGRPRRSPTCAGSSPRQAGARQRAARASGRPEAAGDTREQPRRRSRPGPSRPSATASTAPGRRTGWSERGDRADHEAGRAAEHVAGEQDDVGGRLDVGQRRERDAAERASAASVATIANTAVGCVRSYQAKPSASTAQNTSVKAAMPGHVRDRSCGADSAAPCSGGSSRWRHRGRARSRWRSTSRRRGRVATSRRRSGARRRAGPRGRRTRRRTRGRGWRR